ncbi:MAG: hypothetical protein IPH34_01695 [Chitinophagaceae bacterium]|nr:hypothetical protein [Chitinophagaceae bacterium]
MKSLITLIICSFFAIQLSAQNSPSKTSKPDSTKKIMIVEASCGQCQFKIKGGGCDLAVRLDGKGYFVDGTKIDEHGDAHAEDGFCEAIRKAEVQGGIVNDRFVATYFKLVAEKPKKEKEKMHP